MELGLVYDKSFDRVFTRFYPILCIYASNKLPLENADDARDIVINVFVKLWELKISFESDNHLKAYLYKATLNSCSDFLKLSRRRIFREKDFYNAFYDSEESFYYDVLKFDVWNEVASAITQLPPQAAKVIELSYINGLNLDQIAKQMNLSKQTIKNTKTRAIEKLKSILGKKIFYFFLLFLH
jgi:RNA polymerase sigma factor (sigma-70 family)